MRYKGIQDEEAKKKVEAIKQMLTGGFGGYNGIQGLKDGIQQVQNKLNGMKEPGNPNKENSPKEKLSNRMQNLQNVAETLEKLEKYPDSKELTNEVLIKFELATGENGGTTMQQDLCNLASSTDYQYQFTPEMESVMGCASLCDNIVTRLENEELKIDAEGAEYQLNLYKNGQKTQEEKIKALQESFKNLDGASYDDLKNEKQKLEVEAKEISGLYKSFSDPRYPNKLRSEFSKSIEMEETKLKGSLVGQSYLAIQEKEKQLLTADQELKVVQDRNFSPQQMTGRPTEIQRFYLDANAYNANYKEFKRMDDYLSPFLQQRQKYNDLVKKSKDLTVEERVMQSRYPDYKQKEDFFNRMMQSKTPTDRFKAQNGWELYLSDKPDLKKHCEEYAKTQPELAQANAKLTEMGDALGGVDSVNQMTAQLENARNILNRQRPALESRAHDLQDKLGVKRTAFDEKNPSAIPNSSDILQAAFTEVKKMKASLEKNKDYPAVKASVEKINGWRDKSSGDKIEKAVQNKIVELKGKMVKNSNDAKSVEQKFEVYQNGAKAIKDAVEYNNKWLIVYANAVSRQCNEFLRGHEETQHFADAFKQLQGINPRMNDKRRLFHRDSPEFSDMCKKLNDVMSMDPSQKENAKNQPKALQELFNAADKYVKDKLKDGKSRQGSAMRVARLTQAENIMRICKTAMERMEGKDRMCNNLRAEMGKVKVPGVLNEKSLTADIVKPKTQVKTVNTLTNQKNIQKHGVMEGP